MSRISKINTFIKESPNDPFLHHALALEFLKLNEVNNALASFEFNAVNNPNYVGTYYHLGKIQETQNLILAKATYEKGILIAMQENDLHAAQELKAALAGVNIILDNQ